MPAVNGDSTRRPLLARELPHAERLGRLLATTRRALDLSQADVAFSAGLHRVSIDRLEHGKRRTRRSTLTRIAAAFVLAEPRLGPVERLAESFVDAAGPALAEESVHAERVARRRISREDRAWRRQEAEIREHWFDFMEGYEAYAATHWSSSRNMDEIRTGIIDAMWQDIEEARATRRSLDGLRAR